MTLRFRIRDLCLVACGTALLMLPFAYALMADRGGAADSEPARVLIDYLRASYARDYKRAYRLISAQDRRLKNEKNYLKERGAFDGFTLDAARTLADALTAVPVEMKPDGDQVHIKLRVKLPDANKLAPHLFNWDEKRLNALSANEQRALIQRLNQWSREDKLPMVEGEESFSMIREAGQWRLHFNWADGIRIVFRSRVADFLPLEISWDQHEILARPGELFDVHLSVKNNSDREVFTKVPHRVKPKDLTAYLELVECGILAPLKLRPGEHQRYVSTYMVRADLPDGAREIAVTYELTEVR